MLLNAAKNGVDAYTFLQIFQSPFLGNARFIKVSITQKIVKDKTGWYKEFVSCKPKLNPTVVVR